MKGDGLSAVCVICRSEFIADGARSVFAEAGEWLAEEVWQDAGHPTRFVHVFVWKDAEASRIHGQSPAVKKFAGILYPNCLEPVEFTKYRQIDANAAFLRV